MATQRKLSTINNLMQKIVYLNDFCIAYIDKIGQVLYNVT